MVKLLTGMNVAYVALEWVMLPIWDVIWESTLEKNPSNVTNVAKHLLEQQILNSMNCAMDCHNSNVIIAPSGSNLEKVFWSTKKFFILTVWKVCWKLNWMMNKYRQVTSWNGNSNWYFFRPPWIWSWAKIWKKCNFWLKLTNFEFWLHGATLEKRRTHWI